MKVQASLLPPLAITLSISIASFRYGEETIRLNVFPLVIFLFLIWIVYGAAIKAKTFYGILAFFLYSVIVNILGGEASYSSIFYILYYTSAAFLVLLMADFSSLRFPDLFYYAGLANATAGISFWVISWLASSSFGALVWSSGLTRAEGLLTEPSNMSYILGPLTVMTLHRRNYLLFALVSVCLLLTFSPTVYLVTAAGWLGVLIQKRKLLFAASILAFIFLLGIVVEKTQLLRSAGYFEVAMNRLVGGVLSPFGSADASNTRFDLLSRAFSAITDDPLTALIGLGLGASNVTALSTEVGLTFEANIIFTLWFGFGVFGLFFYAILLRHAFKKTKSFELDVIYIFSIASATANPSGLWLQMLPVALFLMRLDLEKESSSDLKNTLTARRAILGNPKTFDHAS